MADGIEIKLEGVDDAIRALNELADDMRRKVVLGALRDAGKPISQAAKRLAPVLKMPTSRRVPGTMRRAIGVFKSKIYKAANGALGVYIKVRASKAQRRRSPVSGDPFYYRFVEAGHRPRPAKNTAARRRRAATAFVKAYPFLGPAFRQEGQNALRIFEQRIVERIAKANARK
jgi:HK97 gp10 family phage protein